MKIYRERSSSVDSNRAVRGRGRKSESETEFEHEMTALRMRTLFGTIACAGDLTSNPINNSDVSSTLSLGSVYAGSAQGSPERIPDLTFENLEKLSKGSGTRPFPHRRGSTAATTAGSLDEQPKLTFMDLPTEIHLDIVDMCLLLGGFGDNYKSNKQRKFIGGSVRDLTLVNKYFRKLTAPYLFKKICIHDNTEATARDLLKESIQTMMMSPYTQEWMRQVQKFTISLTRSPQPNHQYVEEDVILILDMIRPKTQRFVIEQHSTQWQLLCLVENIWRRWARSGFPHRIYNTKQLEIYAPLGHNWDFQFLANPYVNVERMWLDYNCGLLEPDTLKLSQLASLEYLMVRSFPPTFLDDETDLARFDGWSESRTDGAKLAALARSLPQLKHLAMCGLLNGPIEDLAARLEPMRSLEQLDITDQQAISARQVMEARQDEVQDDDVDWAIAHSRLIGTHVTNIDRAVAATKFFTALPSLRRICFVRDQVGTVLHAIRSDGEESGELERVEACGTIAEERRYLKWQSPKAWLCGFPNVLGYELFDHRDGSYNDTIASDAAFWL
ncbi:hypothetical protein Daus18300_000097 [Diaporthe australafricana]|uniref:F-box domain-containing protein n=1 Tax=Diaporthe australafricana TaxID=127596 RepID=A0ABR3Y6S1_9PEZI